MLLLDEPWSECAALEPATVADVLIMPPHVKTDVCNWVRNRLAGGRGPTALFLSGPGGCGKRTLIKTVARALGAECVEPHVLTLDDVYAAVVGISLPFCTGDRPPPRVFLFTGVDGFMDSCDATAKTAGPTLARLLEYLADRSLRAPPCVFTVQGYSGRTGRAIRTSAAVDRMACYRIAAWAAGGVSRLLSDICGMARVPDMAPQIMTGFDGDIKQALLRLELAIRSRALMMNVHATSKDTEVVDAFEGARIILNTDAPTHFDNMAEIFHRFGQHQMDTILQCNYLEGMSSMREAAAAAHAWSTYAGCVFKHPAMAAGTLALELRLARGAPLPLGQLAYDRRSVRFDSRAEELREFRDGSPRVLEAVSGRSSTLAPPPVFAGDLTHHGISGADCADMLAVLKARFDEVMNGDSVGAEDMQRFTATYGVSSHFMSTYDTGLGLPEKSAAAEAEEAAYFAFLYADGKYTGGKRVPRPPSLPPVSIDTQTHTAQPPKYGRGAGKRGRTMERVRLSPAWPRWKLPQGAAGFPAWWAAQVRTACSTPV